MLEIAIIGAAIQAYLESDGGFALPDDGTDLQALIAAAVAAYFDMEYATI
ncbi:hypothetical protein ABFB09_00920 [Dehalogenimonas sp. THU2]